MGPITVNNNQIELKDLSTERRKLSQTGPTLKVKILIQRYLQ